MYTGFESNLGVFIAEAFHPFLNSIYSLVLSSLLVVLNARAVHIAILPGCQAKKVTKCHM